MKQRTLLSIVAVAVAVALVIALGVATWKIQQQQNALKQQVAAKRKFCRYFAGNLLFLKGTYSVYQQHRAKLARRIQLDERELSALTAVPTGYDAPLHYCLTDEKVSATATIQMAEAGNKLLAGDIQGAATEWLEVSNTIRAQWQ